jgi:hypothetical protein
MKNLERLVKKMDKYYFDLGTVWAVIIALISSIIVISYSMVDNFYLRRELLEAYRELDSRK